MLCSGNQKTASALPKLKALTLKTATAVVAAIGKGTEFKNGRHFAAWLGLVPRQHSSGDRQVLMNMTKKGDKHLRILFIHGTSSVVRVTANNKDGEASVGKPVKGAERV